MCDTFQTPRHYDADKERWHENRYADEETDAGIGYQVIIGITRLVAKASAVALFSSLAHAAIPSVKEDDFSGNSAKLEEFVIAIAEIYLANQVHDPEALKAKLRISLRKNPKSGQDHVGFYASGAPAIVRSISYSIRRMNDGEWYGSLTVTIDSAKSCLRIPRLKELTLLEYRRHFSFSHSRDGTRVHVVERFVAKRIGSRRREISFAAFVNEVGCVAWIRSSDM